MQEDFLHYIWKYKLCNTSNLKTHNGEVLEILNFGTHNTDAGPDFFNGKVKGKISEKLLGEDGFGYDPIFIPNGHNLTFAQMKIEEKNLYSHRSIAIKKLKDYLLSLI